MLILVLRWQFKMVRMGCQNSQFMKVTFPCYVIILCVCPMLICVCVCVCEEVNARYYDFILIMCMHVGGCWYVHV